MPGPAPVGHRGRVGASSGERRTQVVEVVTPDTVVGGGPRRSGPAAGDPSFVEPLVRRICAEYGAVREDVQRMARELLHGFAGARVQAFVPILVEKRLRESYRRLRSAE
jgi:Protein of unknown function (DUF3562)